jgi:uncharacterized protein YjbI with pentapeptide repeats
MWGARLVDGNIGATSLNGVSLVNAFIKNTAGFAGRDYRTGIDIRGIRAENTDFSGSNFAGLEMTGIGTQPMMSINNVTFKNSNLTGANFSGITTAIRDIGISFEGSNLTNTTFANADIHGRGNVPVFMFATGNNTNFSGVDMRGGYFQHVNLTNPNFTNVNLSMGAATFQQPARFFHAVLNNANFTNANLNQAIGFTTATLTSPIWSNTTCPDGTNSDTNGGTCIGHFPPEPFIED